MKPYHLGVILITVVLLSGCPSPGQHSNGGKDSVGELRLELENLLRQHPQNPSVVEPQLSSLANRAEKAAQDKQDAPTTVALYRIAGIAAWQAGEAGGTKALDISNAGSQACANLPGGEQARSTDCTIIKLVAPFAVVDDLQRDLRGLQGQLRTLEQAQQQRCNALAGTERQTCLASPIKLPARDQGEVERIFSGFETQFGKVSTIRHLMDSSLSVDQLLKESADNSRYIIYCSTEATWSLFSDVEGTTQESRRPFTERRKALERELTQTFQTIDCRTVTDRHVSVPIQ
jgi:hypothetical protein